MPSLAVICDDLLGSIKREAKINHLASRFRHYNIQLLYYSSQSFRKVNNVVRQNATNVIIGSPFPNQKELNKIAEEYGDMFGGMMNFLKIYKIATPNTSAVDMIDKNKINNIFFLLYLYYYITLYYISCNTYLFFG